MSHILLNEATNSLPISYAAIKMTSELGLVSYCEIKEKHSKLVSESKKNTTVVVDKFGNKFSTSIYNPRYLSGELKGHTVNFFTAKDCNGNIHHINRQDPRYLSGELKAESLGRKHTKETKNKISNSLKGQKRLGNIIQIFNKNGELVFESNDFIKFCMTNNLPLGAFKKSYKENGSRLYQTKNGIYNAKLKGYEIFEGWFAINKGKKDDRNRENIKRI